MEMNFRLEDCAELITMLDDEPVDATVASETFRKLQKLVNDGMDYLKREMEYNKIASQEVKLNKLK